MTEPTCILAVANCAEDHGTALRLMNEHYAAGDRYTAMCRIYVENLPFGERAAHLEESSRISREAQAASNAFYGWIERPGATAEEMAARAFLDGRWPWGRIDPAYPYLQHARGRQS